MLQLETGKVMESEDGSVEFETLTDDEEVTIPSQDIYIKRFRIYRILIAVMSRLCQIHNEKIGYYLRSPCMGLARDRPIGSALR